MFFDCICSNIVFFDCICSNIVFLAGSLAPRSRRQTRRQDEEKVIVFSPFEIMIKIQNQFLSLFVYFVRLLLVLDLFLLTCQLRSISVGWWGSLYLLNWCPNMYMKNSKNLYLYIICTCLLVTWEAYSSVGEDPCGAERARRQLSMGPHRDGLEPYLAIGVGLPGWIVLPIQSIIYCRDSDVVRVQLLRERVCQENSSPVVDCAA